MAEQAPAPIAPAAPFSITINGKFTAVLLGLFFTTLVGFNAWLASFVVEQGDRIAVLSERMSVTEGNRFTSKDGFDLMENILGKLPPEWLLEDVRDNQLRLKELEKQR